MGKQPPDVKKRHAVFFQDPQVVLVKIFAVAPFGCLTEKTWTTTRARATDERHESHAHKRDLDPRAYRREKPDSGYSFFPEKHEPNVSVAHLVAQLEAQGLVYTGGHWQDRPDKGPVTTLEFRRGEAAVEMPTVIRAVLSERCAWNHLTAVWANLPNPDGGVPFRLDTINVAKVITPTGATRHLVMDGRTYRLVSSIQATAVIDAMR